MMSPVVHNVPTASLRNSVMQHERMRKKHGSRSFRRSGLSLRGRNRSQYGDRHVVQELGTESWEATAVSGSVFRA
jgi:hypothetical protein